MKWVNCILCNVDDTRPMIEIDGGHVVQCNHCGLAYLNPRPSESEVAGFYEEEYFENQPDIHFDTAEPDVKRAMYVHWGKLRRIEAFKRPGRLLDFGCGSGFFLACARERGWQTQGVEISQYAAAFAREVLGLDVFVGGLTELPIVEPFDVVVMLHSLEHLPRPADTLRQIRSLLEPDGLIVVQVPNIKSLDARYHGLRWEGWQLPVHLYHFSPRSLRAVLAKAGFKLRQLDFQTSYLVVKPLAVLGGRDLESRAVSMAIEQPTSSALIPWVKGVLRQTLGRVCPGRDMTAYAVPLQTP